MRNLYTKVFWEKPSFAVESQSITIILIKEEVFKNNLFLIINDPLCSEGELILQIKDHSWCSRFRHC